MAKENGFIYSLDKTERDTGFDFLLQHLVVLCRLSCVHRDTHIQDVCHSEDPARCKTLGPSLSREILEKS